ncbi:hypothetical protein [Actinorugispora endophytica]|uniref:DUF2567 domain-containing protein n=1 Tax=Actinorugispora endophytica TaxID=1605990 RepID=A0A4R6UN04_9ACTN|nr:hypothetical protein [Actinorugispora endophytica]TDQ48498.1 hypothetical protein EV190_11834 [Actinorugispora endophytica]
MTERNLAAGAVVFGGVAILGVPLGVLWWLVAPRAEVTATSGGVAYYPLSEAGFAGEGHYALMMLAAGLLTGYLGYLTQYGLARRHRVDLRLPVLVGLAAGTLAGSFTAWLTGAGLDAGAAHAALTLARPGDVVQAGLALRSHSALLLWPFATVLQYGLFDAVSVWREDLPHLDDPAPADGLDAGVPKTGAAER